MNLHGLELHPKRFGRVVKSAFVVWIGLHVLGMVGLRWAWPDLQNEMNSDSAAGMYGIAFIETLVGGASSMFFKGRRLLYMCGFFLPFLVFTILVS